MRREVAIEDFTNLLIKAVLLRETNIYVIVTLPNYLSLEAKMIRELNHGWTRKRDVADSVLRELTSWTYSRFAVLLYHGYCSV